MKRAFAFIMTFAIMLTVLAFVGQKNLAPPPPAPNPPAIKELQPKTATFEEAKNAITEEDVRTQLSYLTSSELEGRMSGMKGNRTAADYLVKWMKTNGVGPGAEGSYLQSFRVNKTNESKEQSTGETANIIGMLPGSDPALVNEYIIVGAHFDHIGYGPSMSQAPNRREIHPGADDNATGTCVVMACIKGFGMLKKQNKRTIVFVHFSGEEMGLVGARYYCSHPIYPLKSTLVMINQDMVGRLRNQTMLAASGASANPAISQVVQQIKGYKFQMRPTGGTGGGSDHAAFADKGVPVIMFHTGQHAQYHTPDDRVDLCDLPGLHQICQAVFEMAWRIDKIPSRAVQVYYENISFDTDHKGGNE